MYNPNYISILVAVVAAFVASMLWYTLFGNKLAKINPKAYADVKRPGPLKIFLELLRNLILAFVLQYILVRLGVIAMTGAVFVGFLLWLGFPFILLTGSVLHEKVPTKLAVIHAGDWLIKILLISIILSLWH